MQAWLSKSKVLCIGVLCLAATLATAQLASQTTWVKPGRATVTPEVVDLSKTNEYYADPTHPNIAGFWRPAAGGRASYYVKGEALPRVFKYYPEWQATYEGRMIGEETNMAYGDPAGSCWPQGMFHGYVGSGNQMQITQLPGMTRVVLERATQNRRIYTDGRLHPAGWVPTSEGHSIGHWEDNTLVVDTIGVRPEITFGFRLPHSSKVEFIERFRLIDPETLAIYFTIVDPIAMPNPGQTVLYYKRGPKGGKFAEDFCTENNRNDPDENLIVQVNLEPRKTYGFDLPDDPDDE